MAITFASLNLASKGLEEEYEKKIDNILSDPAQVSARTRVLNGNYSITMLIDKAIDPGSFLALRAKYISAGWDDLVMNSGESLTLVKAIP